jgi:hypothetical protein
VQFGDASKLHGKLDEGKRYPERFDRRVIGICMGNNEVSDGVLLGRVEDVN